MLDLTQGSILILGLHEPFDPSHPDLRLTEVARTLLVTTPSSSRADALARSLEASGAVDRQGGSLRDLLSEKLRDPVLGVI